MEGGAEMAGGASQMSFGWGRRTFVQTDPDPRTAPFLGLGQIDVTLQHAGILKKMNKMAANV